MLILPAIFMQKGKVVSFYKGNDNAEKKSYAKAPQSFAQQFQKQGAKRLFVIDLDGDQSIRMLPIREKFQGELWWAGKVRDMQTLEECFSNGADKVVLGQSAKAIHNQALEKYGSDKIVAGLKVKHYDDAPDICEALGGSGFKTIVLKDMNAEGTLFQPNFDLMEKCVYFSNLEVFASGGVADEQHMELLKRAGVTGVVMARALYENVLNLETLVKNYEE